MLKATVSWDVTPEYSVASDLANCISHGAALVYAYIEKTGVGVGVGAGWCGGGGEGEGMN